MKRWQKNISGYLQKTEQTALSPGWGWGLLDGPGWHVHGVVMHGSAQLLSLLPVFGGLGRDWRVLYVGGPTSTSWSWVCQILNGQTGLRQIMRG